jgi:hypothetical protein
MTNWVNYVLLRRKYGLTLFPNVQLYLKASFWRNVKTMPESYSI